MRKRNIWCVLYVFVGRHSPMRVCRWTDTTNMDELAKTLEFESMEQKTFVKITLLVLLTFADRGSYQSYLNQEAEFLMIEGQRDRYTDRTTHLTGR